MPANELPWKPSAYSTVLKGLTLGDRFVDEHGFIYAVYQVHTTLVGTALADKQTVVFQADGIVTDDVSAGLDTTSPIAAGVVCGTIPVSTASITYYGLFMIKGRKQISTKASSGIVVGDGLVTSGSDDGVVLRLDKTATTILAANYLGKLVGIARGSEASSLVLASIDICS